MLIGIDASRAITRQRTGTEKYSRDLIFALAGIDTYNKYILYVGPNYDNSFDSLPKNFSVKIIGRKKYWTQIGLSLEMFRTKPDVLFVPSHILPIITPKKCLVTIHDLAWKYFPQAYSKDEIRLNNLGIRRAIKKKAKIIVYSLSTEKDLKKYYKVADNLIHFVPMGFEAGQERGDIGEKIRDLSANPYILFVGRIEMKKNIINLIKAYTLLRTERKIKNKLLLVGKPGFGYDQIKAEITSSKFCDDIIETGYIDDAERDFLYQKADLFVLPSFFEGFGYPILEAFAAGIPVVTSKTSSMLEVAGNGAVLINPEKPFEIAAAMSQILNKPALKEKLIRAGKNQIKKYSWELCASETLKVLESK